MNEWIECDDWQKIPEGQFLVKIKSDSGLHEYEICDCVLTGKNRKIITAGGRFSFDFDGLIAYAEFSRYEDGKA